LIPGLQTATTTGLGVGATGSSTITEIGSYTVPEYRSALKYDASVSAEVRTALEAQRVATVKAIEVNPEDFAAWLNLGILRKMAGDYRGAEAIWIFTSANWPTSPTSFNNLGDLYQNFLKDPVKAKAAYDQAAKLQASQ
jgi:tetratricopeptide (TPR) repeat protein